MRMALVASRPPQLGTPAYLPSVIRQYVGGWPYVITAGKSAMGNNSLRPKPDSVYVDQRAAMSWVEEIVHMELCAHVPPTCLVGWYRHGLADGQGPEMVIPEDSVTSIWRYAYVGADFRWEEVGTYRLEVHEPSYGRV